MYTYIATLRRLVCMGNHSCMRLQHCDYHGSFIILETNLLNFLGGYLPEHHGHILINGNCKKVTCYVHILIDSYRMTIHNME